MDRRSFLTGWAQREVELAPQNNSFSNGSHDRVLSTTLKPWVPSTTEPWDAVRAGHLLRRTMMMPKRSEITQILALTPSAAVDLLLNTPSNPAVPPSANFETESLDGLDNVLANQLRGTWAGQAGQLRDWYANVLLNSPLSIVEKMTFFWSGLLTSQFVADESYVIAPLLYRQNKLYRDTGLLNYKDLIFNATLDGAMSIPKAAPMKITDANSWSFSPWATAVVTPKAM